MLRKIAQHKYILVLCVLSTGEKVKCQHEVNLDYLYLLCNSILGGSVAEWFRVLDLKSGGP